MQKYSVKITGVTPLLQNHDNLAWDDVMRKWQKEPSNTKLSTPGDDRTPAFRWIGKLYLRGNNVIIPSDNLMPLLREGGAKCPTGSGRKTFKALTQSGLFIEESSWDLYDPTSGKPYLLEGLDALKNEMDFTEHEQWALDHGFELSCKRARIMSAKHVRVRPQFNNWAAEGTITVMEDTITRSVLTNILTFAGCYSGLGDWRPSSPKSPGTFGRFTVEVEK